MEAVLGELLFGDPAQEQPVASLDRPVPGRGPDSPVRKAFEIIIGQGVDGKCAS